ncbi:uncharacterized protein LOC127704680 isoform X1 [Mytilus californianus]|uniref:uncharacterized protein LOC127704680 isoform X1 n=1 Tax=Mytilus californianus TaxID=6549 RepID=UPI0022470C51|nr:uncharacterized protein LOC127704680 isoform X1 [Mytilus californianus]
MALSPEPGTGGFSSDAILDRYRPMSNTKTTYGYMNSWTNLRDAPSGVPQTIADTNYKNAQRDDHDVLYNKTYADLTSKIAYRHPNPGVPRQRQGRIGGSWRHIKEVLGHGGSRVVYVDGLISVYDKENFNQHLNAQLPFRPHLKKTLYSPTRHDYTQTTYNPWEDCEGKVGKFPPVAASDPDLQRKLNIQSASKYKGFYHYNKN